LYPRSGVVMRIAYVLTRADPIGGAQIHVRDVATAMQAAGHSTVVVTGGRGPFLEDLAALGVPTVVAPHLTVPIRPLDDLRALREIRAALASFRPDLVAVHSSKAGILGRLAGRSLRMPVVLTAHGWSFTPGIPDLQAALYRRIERLAGPLAARIITVSEFDRRLGIEAGIAPADRIVTVYNGMPDVAPALRADPARAPARLVMVARYGPQKDHPTLLHALAGLKELPWELDLVGEGPLRQEVEELTRALGLGDRVHFLGQRMDVDRILAGAQVSLLATNWEGFPLSILEAMRARLPVVASAVGGVAESVRDEDSGYLVPRAGVEILRDRIGRLVADPGLRARMGESGRARYERDFTLARCAARTLDVYQDVLAGAGDGAAARGPVASAAG
jgi:glycosyltransferase involved in cell wall biosynthesis